MFSLVHTGNISYKLDKIAIRSAIQFKKINTTDILRNIQQRLYNDAPSTATSYRYVTHFKPGDAISKVKNVLNHQHVTIPQMVEKVQDVV